MRLIQLPQDLKVVNKFILDLTNQIKIVISDPSQQMNYIFSTPQNSASLKKEMYNTTSSGVQEDCPYCQMKKKFNIGSTGQQRCFQHSIKITADQTNQQQKSSELKDGFLTADQMVDLLEEVEISLDYYWDHLRQISGGNATQIHRQLQPVLGCVKRVQQKIGKFFYDNPMDVSQIKPISTYTSLHRKFMNSSSQKFLRVDLSNIFDPQQNNATESIKQWVMHFYKMLQIRQVPENFQPLPYEQELEMRIFKQSMERKFVQFTEQLKNHEQKVKDVLSKLIFYMQKSSGAVQEKQIQEDILFIEGQHTTPENRESELERMLLVQASTMQYMLHSSGCQAS